MSELAVYWDYNSTAPPKPGVLEAMREVEAVAWGNPASVHRAGRAARAVLEKARETIAGHLDIYPRDLVFTSGGTEANNLGLAGDGPLVVSRLEHPSVTAWAELEAARGRCVRWADVSEDGTVTAEALDAALASAPKGATVALMAVNHETGVVQDLEGAAQVAMRRRARLHVDAVQWVGKASPSVLAYADTLSIGAHKLGGPKGIGALAFRGAPPSAVLAGGAQERGLRPGTQAATLARGFARAIELIDLSAQQSLAALRDRLDLELAPYSERNGSGARLPHVTNRSFFNWRGPELVAALDLEGIECASGSACSAGTTEPSTVIAAMAGAERAGRAVRFSLGYASTGAELEQALPLLRRVLDLAGG